MKLKKTAIAVAIAGVAAAPMMASAATTVSGVIQLKLQGTDVDDDKADFAAGDIRIGLATDHELNSGLTGYGNLQLNLDDLSNSGGDTITTPGLVDDDGEPVASIPTGTIKSDNVYVGLKGGFGDVRWGEIPLAVEYGQLANDIHDVGDDVVDGLSYTGTFGMFGFGLNYSPSEDTDMYGAGVKFNFAGATIGLGFEDRDELTNLSAGASYAISGVSLAAQFWSQGQLDVETVQGTTTITNDLDDKTNYAVKAGYTISGVTLGLTYSVLTTAINDDADDEESVLRLDAAYDLGGQTEISTRISNTSKESGLDNAPDIDDLLEWRIQLAKTF